MSIKEQLGKTKNSTNGGENRNHYCDIFQIIQMSCIKSIMQTRFELLGWPFFINVLYLSTFSFINSRQIRLKCHIGNFPLYMFSQISKKLKSCMILIHLFSFILFIFSS